MAARLDEVPISMARIIALVRADVLLGKGIFKSDGLGKEAAIDAKINAGDEAAGGGAGEKNDRAHQLGAFAKPAHGGVIENRLGARSGRSILLEEELPVLFGGEKAG